MVEPGSSRAPDGITVDDVDWLPSGARSGIVRVQGRRAADAAAELPLLVVGGQRFSSLPDTAAAGPDGWRGAYVVEAALALSARDLSLEWPSGETYGLDPLGPEPAGPPPPHLAVVATPADEDDMATADVDPEPEPKQPAAAQADAGGEVVDRAVMAERRAGRAEAALRREAHAAQDALAAVEALELRSAALAQDLQSARAERDALRARVVPDQPSARETALERELAEREAEAQELRAAVAASGLAAGSAGSPHAPDVDREAERRAAALTQALTEAVAEVDALRGELHEQLILRRTRDVAAGADRVALVALVSDLDTLRAAAEAARDEAAVYVSERDAARAALEQARAEAAGAEAAHDETRRRFTERVAELREARGRIADLEAELAAVRLAAEEAAAAHDAELAVVRDDAEQQLAVARDAAEQELAAAHDVAEQQLADARLAAEEVASAYEAQLAAARLDADQAAAAHATALAAARDEARRNAELAAERLAAAEARAAEHAASAREVERLRVELDRADADLRRAEVAREAAVASALAANALRQAAAVRGADTSPERVAALEAELLTLRARLAERPEPEPQLPPVTTPDEVIARAAAQVRAAAARHTPEPKLSNRLVADLDAAAAALRASTPAPQVDPPAAEAALVPADADHPAADPPAADPLPAAEAPAAADETAPSDAPTVADAPTTEDPAASDAPLADDDDVADRAADTAAADPPPAVAPTDDADEPTASTPATAGEDDDDVADRAADTAAADPPVVLAPADSVLPGVEPAPVVEEERPRRAITPGPAQLPNDLARGTGGRSYPPLRGGVVKLAHDDPAAAARLLASLGSGLHAFVDHEVTLDLTLAELGETVALDAAGDRTTVAAFPEPRARRAAKVHVRTDAVTLAEALAGVGPSPRRRGPLRAVRGRRKARQLAAALTADRRLTDLVQAGARLDPALAIRAFAYAVPPAWTRGHGFTAAITVDGATTGLHVVDGGGISANGPVDDPDVVLTIDRAAFDSLLAGTGSPAMDGRQLQALRGWAVRLGAIPR